MKHNKGIATILVQRQMFWCKKYICWPFRNKTKDNKDHLFVGFFLFAGISCKEIKEFAENGKYIFFTTNDDEQDLLFVSFPSVKMVKIYAEQKTLT